MWKFIFHWRIFISNSKKICLIKFIYFFFFKKLQLKKSKYPNKRNRLCVGIRSYTQELEKIKLKKIFTICCNRSQPIFNITNIIKRILTIMYNFIKLWYKNIELFRSSSSCLPIPGSIEWAPILIPTTRIRGCPTMYYICTNMYPHSRGDICWPIFLQVWHKHCLLLVHIMLG